MLMTPVLFFFGVHAGTFVIHANHRDVEPLELRRLPQCRQAVHRGAVA
jgi:hypothetical protein